MIYAKDGFKKGEIYLKQGRFETIAERVQVPENCPCFDAKGQRVVPGFIDIHTHGGAGVDVNTATAQQLNETVGAFFASQGTTSWLASVLTDTPEQTLWCIQQINQAVQSQGMYAQLLGLHLEGPFLSKEYKGAMPEHLLQKGNVELFRKYQQAAQGNLKYITISPEIEGAAEMIQQISSQVSVAIGHSGADYETSMDCIHAGAISTTHVLNAMKLLHQHHPGIMGAVLESDVYCEAICDGRHLHPATVRFLIKCKGLNRIIAVTDSIMAAGLPDGKYKLGVNDVIVVDGDAKLAENGVRAGSTLTTKKALKNLVEFTNKPLEQLIPFLTENPAKMLGIEKQKGCIQRGADADFVVLDQNLNVTHTFVEGRMVYSDPLNKSNS